MAAGARCLLTRCWLAGDRVPAEEGRVRQPGAAAPWHLGSHGPTAAPGQLRGASRTPAGSPARECGSSWHRLLCVGVWWVPAQEAGRRRGAQGPAPPLSIPWFSPLGSSGPCPCGSGPGTYRLALSASFSPTLGLCSVKSRNEHSSPPPASVPMALERLSQGLAVQSLTVRKAPAHKGSMQRNGKDRGGLLCPGACTLSGLPGVHSQRTCP